MKIKNIYIKITIGIGHLPGDKKQKQGILNFKLDDGCKIMDRCCVNA